MKKHLFLLIVLMGCFISQSSYVYPQYRLWYNAPAPDTGIVFPVGESDRPLDLDWESWSLPIGNGYMGASIFGRTDSERLQFTDKTLYIKGLWNSETNTSFADVYLDFFHSTFSNYQRSLELNKAVAHVTYEHDGVRYEREYFASYPDNVIVMKVRSDKAGALSFTVRPVIPYLAPFGALQRTDSITRGYLSGRTVTRHSYNGRTGKITAQDNLITLRGETEYLHLIYEAQIKVIPFGGKMIARNDDNLDHGTISVQKADSAVILFTLGTNYQCRPETFLNKHSKKLEENPDPHNIVSATLANAAALNYDELLKRHIADYSQFFQRVQLNLGVQSPDMPTDQLIAAYKQGTANNYLEELFFHYGRYLLISTSRKGTLPPTLQGVWNQYELAPWNGNYTHNINIQMNYWPAFNTNLAELFESYVDYHKAYKKAAEQMADRYIKIWEPSLYSEKGNGWTIGTGNSAYSVSMPGGHSGPGMAALTSKLFWEYYNFTSDTHILKDTTYPAIYGVAEFLSKTVKDTLGHLLAYPSSSPEQYSKATNKPYPTTGCAFDQQMIYENHHDVITAAKLLKDKNKNISLFEKQIKRLDPVQIGASGQVKEYREEKYYGDIVLEPHHRHISNLMGLYPGCLITESTPAWLDAAKVTLNARGDVSTGWSMAHKVNLWARAKEGERAHQVLSSLLKTATLNNLWTNCIAVLRSPYQIDANFGGTAGIAEMLLQSHEGYIHLLPALPNAWKNGSYAGLVARGNFEVSAQWTDGNATVFKIHSRKGNVCTLKYPLLSHAQLTNSKGKIVSYKVKNTDRISFSTIEGEIYTIRQIPNFTPLSVPNGGSAHYIDAHRIKLQWEGQENSTFNIYRTVGNQSDYALIASNIKETEFEYYAEDIAATDYVTFKIVTTENKGEESKGLIIHAFR